MEKEFDKIESYIDKIVPLEKLINEVRKIENIHNNKNNRRNKHDRKRQRVKMCKDEQSRRHQHHDHREECTDHGKSYRAEDRRRHFHEPDIGIDHREQDQPH